MAKEAILLAGTAATKDGGAGGVFRRAPGGAWEHVFTAADVHAITPHPTEPDTVFLGSKDGPYISTDRGAHWERLGFPDRGVQVWSILVDPHDPRTVYAGTAPVGVYRSTDGGAHFTRLPDPALPERVRMDFPCRVMRFAAHPTRPGELYATLEVNGAMHSADGGESWQDCSADLVRLADQPHLKSRILSDTETEGMLDGHAIAITAADPDAVYLAVRMGIFRSTDQGRSWQDIEVGRYSPYTYGRDIRVAPTEPRVMYAALSVASRSNAGALWRSDDLGASWRRFDKVTPHATVMGIGLHRTDPAQVAIAARGGEVFATTDAGATWQELPLPPAGRDAYAIACM
jgi:Sortilin, neurotensin receptor 3,